MAQALLFSSHEKSGLGVSVMVAAAVMIMAVIEIFEISDHG